VRPGRKDEESGKTLEWPCMELKDLSNNHTRNWHFAASNDEQNQMWQNRIESKINELNYISSKKQECLVEQKLKAEQANANKSFFSGARRPSQFDKSRNVDVKVLELLRSPTSFGQDTKQTGEGSYGDAAIIKSFKVRKHVLCMHILRSRFILMVDVTSWQYDDGEIDIHAALALAHSIDKHTYLEEVSFRNSLSSNVLAKLATSLTNNKSITKLDLSQNKFMEGAFVVRPFIYVDCNVRPHVFIHYQNNIGLDSSHGNK
jgi:hypothetical protein